MLLLVQLFMLFSVMLAFALPTWLVIVASQHFRTGRYGRDLRVASLIVAGFFGGGLLLWAMVPSTWTLSFLTTLGATVDAKTYGHEIEHTAEIIVFRVLSGCVLGALLSGAAVAIATRLRVRPLRG
jgi:hypothetical protein